MQKYTSKLSFSNHPFNVQRIPFFPQQHSPLFITLIAGICLITPSQSSHVLIFSLVTVLPGSTFSLSLVTK